MSETSSTPYSFGITVPGSFEQVKERVQEAFKEQGFGKVTEMDVRKTLQEKIGEQIEPYTVLGMCNPRLASQAIASEHEIGLMLPCNVLVHECGGQVRVSVQDPVLMMQIAGNEALRPIANEARQRIESALDTLGAPAGTGTKAA